MTPIEKYIYRSFLAAYTSAKSEGRRVSAHELNYIRQNAEAAGISTAKVYELDNIAETDAAADAAGAGADADADVKRRRLLYNRFLEIYRWQGNLWGAVYTRVRVAELVDLYKPMCPSVQDIANEAATAARHEGPRPGEDRVRDILEWVRVDVLSQYVAWEGGSYSATVERALDAGATWEGVKQARANALMIVKHAATCAACQVARNKMFADGMAYRYYFAGEILQHLMGETFIQYGDSHLYVLGKEWNA